MKRGSRQIMELFNKVWSGKAMMPWADHLHFGKGFQFQTPIEWLYKKLNQYLKAFSTDLAGY